MTRKQFLENTDSAELTAWLALDSIEAEEEHKRRLMARAQAAQAGRR
jgi:hypothetical protein